MFDYTFLRTLDAFITAYPASLVRWFSTDEHNRLVKGAPNSAHLLKPGKANAVDLIYDSKEQLYKAAWSASAYGFTGIELDLTNLHLHLDTMDRGHLWHVAHHAPGIESPLDDHIKTVYPGIAREDKPMVQI